MKLPFDWEDRELQPADFVLFRPFFANTLKELFSCKAVCFAGTEYGEPGPDNVPERYLTGLNKAHESGVPVADAEDPILYVPIFYKEKLLTIAALANVAPHFFDKPVSWLVERSTLAVREFNLIKRGAIDPATGLFASQHFYKALQEALARHQNKSAGESLEPGADTTHPGEPEGLTLFLLEMSPRARESRQSLLYIARAGGHLNSFVGHLEPVYHLGAGVFGIIWETAADENAMKIGNAFLDWLKREHVIRVHIGITSIAGGPGKNRISPQVLVEQAWSALDKARHRGPYGLCTYADPEGVDVFSPKIIPGAVLRQLKKFWKGVDSFALILLHQDNPTGEKFLRRALSLAGPDVRALPLNDHEALVFCPHADAEQAEIWGRDLRRKIKKNGGPSFSTGIGVYPCHDFKKNDMPVNARKALAHTGFFGPGTGAVFDAVSLNISGDVYYNEGYLTKAVREYRQGLALDPNSVNLLNSLGVAYAQMNRHNIAVPLFEKALASDHENFMALCNLGFSQMAVGKNKEATVCFERAIVLDNTHFDLLLQLGRLYCQADRFKEAVDILNKAEKLHDGDKVDIGYGAVYRYLGEAYKELDEIKKAMRNLQKALVHNPRDAAALSLLGEVYALGGEGKEVALSMCHQAVEFDESQWEHWYRLGKVQSILGYGPAAAASLKECLRREKDSVPALFLLAGVYEGLGKTRQALGMYERVLRISPGHKKAEVALAALGS